MPDTVEIRTLLNQLYYAADSGDYESFIAMLARAEWVFEGGESYFGAQAIKENVLSNVINYDDGTPRTRHINTNVEIDIDQGATTAKCRRYLTVLQQTDDFPLQVIFSAVVRDQFAKEDGAWHFTKTIICEPLFGDMSHHTTEKEFGD